ncbi:MAG: penicillin-insensitive murein endopeptidase [Myxococcota bacterium]|nr:penicillin-insensitive murein endopeptidase [Myxococcota bacterium]
MSSSSNWKFETLIIVAGLFFAACCAPRTASRAQTDTLQEQNTTTPLPEPLSAAEPLEPLSVVEHVVEEEPVHYPFFMAEDPLASVSVGNTSTGRLINGHALALPALHYDVLPEQYARNLLYGTQELLDMLVFGAEQVAARFPGSKLWLGNIGRKDGGDIPWSVSHNAGRDADMAYYALNPLGWHVSPPDLVDYNRKLRSKSHEGFYRFDVPRNAHYLLAVHEHPESDLQYVFIASYLQRPILDYLRQAGVETSLVDELASTLHQPGNSSPHSDHAHLRIACSKQDICGGCRNLGPERPWMASFEQTRDTCIQEISRIAQEDPSPHQRAHALERLGLLDAEQQRNLAIEALADADAGVRAAAVTLLGQFGEATQILLKHDSIETELAVRCRLAEALAQDGSSKAWERLAQNLSAEFDCEQEHSRPQEASVPYAAKLASLAAFSESKWPVAALIERLADERAELRSTAAFALARLTNRLDGVDWSEADASARLEALEQWRSWYAANEKSSREQWLLDGFRAQGFAMKKLDKKAIPSLLDAIAAEGPISYNAQRVLMRLTKHEPESLDWPTADALWHWTRYCKKHQRKLGIKLDDRDERGNKL